VDLEDLPERCFGIIKDVFVDKFQQGLYVARALADDGTITMLSDLNTHDQLLKVIL
jgi:hypothetical protein